MLDRTGFHEAIEDLVAELADSRQCLETKPERFEARVLDLATVHCKGVTNVMGHVAHQVALNPRFNPTRKARIVALLHIRGVGRPQPELLRF